MQDYIVVVAGEQMKTMNIVPTPSLIIIFYNAGKQAVATHTKCRCDQTMSAGKGTTHIDRQNKVINQAQLKPTETIVTKVW